MTLPVTADPPACVASAQHAAAHIHASCLRDGPVGRVGLEVEAHCFDLTDPLRRPGWAELSDAIATVGALPGGSTITVEPGGAVELSGPPLDEAKRCAAYIVDQLDARDRLSLVAHA